MVIHLFLDQFKTNFFSMASTNTKTVKKAAGGDKRETIMRAATKVFARRGYFNAKVADVAKEAGIADGTVYLYFKSKEEILHSVFDQAMDEFIDEGRKELEKIEKPQDKLRRIAELHLEKLGTDRDMAIVFQIELRGSTKFMQEFSAAGFAEYLAIIHETIEEGQRQKIFRDDIHPIICAKILYGALDEMVTNWILSPKNYELAPLADEVLKIFLGGVSAK